MALSDRRAHMQHFFGKSIKFTGVLYKQNKLRGPIQGHESDAAVYPMSINAISINIPFISKAFKWLKRYLTAPSSCSEN